METVQIQCGSCHRVMAINVEHLGSQVHCPHCQAIVQAPPRTTVPNAGVRTPAQGAVQAEIGESESIFAGPEASDDIFGGTPRRATVEMPDLPPTVDAPLPDLTPAGHHQVTSLPSTPRPQSHASSLEQTIARRCSTRPLPSPLPGPIPRRARTSTPAIVHWQRCSGAFDKPSSMAPILLIFLIPYAILATLVIAYLLYIQGRSYDPLESCPTPGPRTAVRACRNGLPTIRRCQPGSGPGSMNRCASAAYR